MSTFVSADPAAEATFIESGRKVMLEAERATGWSDIQAIEPNGRANTNVRVWNAAGRYMDIKLPAHML